MPQFVFIHLSTLYSMFSSRTIFTLLILILATPVLHAGQIELATAIPTVESAEMAIASEVHPHKAKRRWFKRKKDEVVGSRTGFWGLISSSVGGVTVLLTLFLTGPQGVFLLGAGLILVGIGLGIATLSREKGKPRSAEWKMALAAIIVGALPLLFTGLIFLGFLLA